MESSNMGNLRTGGSRMEASRKESTHMGTLRTGGSRMEASRMESSRMEGSHMGALHTGGSRMGGGGSRMDPGRVQAAEIRHPVKQVSILPFHFFFSSIEALLMFVFSSQTQNQSHDMCSA